MSLNIRDVYNKKQQQETGGRSISDVYKNKKEEQENTQEDSKSSRSISNVYKEKTAQDTAWNIAERANKWVTDVNNLRSDYITRFGAENAGYRGDATDYFNSLTAQTTGFNTEAEDILKLMNDYSDYLDKDWMDTVTDMLSATSQYRRDMDSMVMNAYDDERFWSRWKDEDEYLSAVSAWEEEEATRKKYESYDAEKGAAKIERLKYYSDRKKELEAIIARGGIGSNVDEINSSEGAKNKAILDLQNLYAEYDKEFGAKKPTTIHGEPVNPSGSSLISDPLANGAPKVDFDELLTEAERFDTLAKRYQDAQRLSAVGDKTSDLYDPNFDTLSQYTPDVVKDADEYSRKVASGEIDPKYLFLNDREGYNQMVYALSEMRQSGNATFLSDNIMVDDTIIKHLSENEKALYNYYYNTGGVEAANSYLDAISESLNSKRGKEIVEKIGDRPLLQRGYGVVAGLDQFATGMKNLFSDEYVAPSATQYAGQMINEELGDNGLKYYNAKSKSWEQIKIFGKSTAQIAYEMNVTNANMLPSILAGLAVEALLPTVGEGALVTATLAAKIGSATGATLLGLSAAGNAKNEMLELGYSKKAANNYALLVGASEAGLSYLIGSIPGISSGGIAGTLTEKALKSVDNALAKVAILFADGADEAFEEGIQTVLETWFKEIATGVDFEDPNLDEVLYSSLLGFLSSAGFGGGKIAVDTVKDGTYNKNLGKDYVKHHGQEAVGDLIGKGLEMNQSTAAYKQAQKLQGKLDKGKKTSNYSVGKLYLSMSEAQISTALQARLTSEGVSETEARKLGNTVTDIIRGREVSNSKIAEVVKNSAARTVLNESIGAKIEASASVSDVKAAIKSYQEVAKSTNGRSAQATDKDGSAVKISGGNVTFSMQKNTDGGFDVVGEAEGESRVLASFKSQKQAEAAVYAMTLGMRSEGMKGLVTISESLPEGVSLGDAALVFNAIYNQGKSGKAMSAVKNMDLLSLDQRQYAYQNGIVDGLLEKARSEKSSDGVLQNDGESGKIDSTSENPNKVEDSAIWHYKSSESYKINEAIRSGRELTTEESAFIEDLDSELENVPKYRGVVYRNMTFDLQGQEALDQFVFDHSEGVIVTYPAYTSTSKSKDGYVVEGELLVHIEIYGENGHDVSKGYGLEEEQEVLFGRKTDFLVKSISYDGKTANIVMEELVYEESEVSGGIEGNKSTQQGYHTEGRTSQMQRVQAPRQMDVQEVSRRDSQGDPAQRGDLRGVRAEVSKSDARRAAEYYLERLKRESAELGIDFDYQQMLARLEHTNMAEYGDRFGDRYSIRKKSNGKYVAHVDGEGSGGFVAAALEVECDTFDEAYLAIQEYFMERNDTLREAMLEEYENIVTEGGISDSNAQQSKENAIEPERVVYSSEKAMAYDAAAENQLDAEQKKAVSIGKDIGRKVVIADTRNAKGVRVDGFLGEDGVIYISKYNKAPVAFVFKHELAHFCERAGQKYRDFMKAVQFSATFKRWLKQKGYNSMLEYNSQIRKERAEIGIDPGEDGANNEIIANFVAEMMFGDDTTIADKLIGELKPKQRRSVRQFLRDFLDWIKSRFTGKGNTARSEILRLEKMFGRAFRTAVNVEQGNGEQFSLLIHHSDGIVKELLDAKEITNDEIIQYLNMAKSGELKRMTYFPVRKNVPQVIVDTLKQVGEDVSDLSLVMQVRKAQQAMGVEHPGERKNKFGNNIRKHALTPKDIITIMDNLDNPSLIIYQTNRIGKDGKPLPNNIAVFVEYITDGEERVAIIEFDSYIDPDNINDKRGETRFHTVVTVLKPDTERNGVSYDYAEELLSNPNNIMLEIKREPSARSATGEKHPNTSSELLSNDSISQKTEKSTQNSKKISEDGSESFSYNPQNENIKDVFGRLRNGEISLNEAEKLLEKSEKDNPVNIANTKKEDMSTTPKLNKKTTGNVGDGDSKFADSIQKSKIFNEDFKAEMKDDNFVKHYAAVTNKETLAEAARRLDEGGAAYAVEWFSKKVAHMDTVDTMVGFILLKRYQDAGDYSNAVAVAQKVREVGTLSGQRLQAFSIIGRFDADMMQAYAQKELDDALAASIKDRGEAWGKKNKERFKLTDEEIAFIRDNILYAAKMPENSRARAIALAQITTLIQNKIPPVRGQSYKAWQRVSMLLNPKTQIRNVTGNLIAAPVFVASDWFSTPVDFVVSKFTGVRTTGLTGVHGTKANLKAAGKGLFESCDDFRRHINTKNVSGNRFEIGQGKSFDETRWGRIAKIMNSFDEFTSFLLDAGDRPFYEMWFTNSLNEQMRLNKVSEPTEEMVQIAVDEALARTWQDDNLVTKMVSGIKKAANHIQIGGYGVGDVIVKFTKTPANLTKAIYDFSPAAIATLAPQAIRLTKAIKNGTVTPSMQKKFVSNFGKMAAGTMLYVVFAALYAAGHISGSSDEDKDVAAFEKYIQGMPAYSIKIGNTWLSYDWAQPIGAIPAIIADYMESREEGSTAIASVWEAFKAGGDVLYNQSFMSSFQTLFTADDPLSGVLDLVLGEITVPIPTVFSQLANVLDDKRRVTYDSTSEIKSAINRAMLKIPGLRNTLEAEIDVLGREIDNSQKNWFNAFLNPANTYTDTSTEITDHAYEIYQSTGDVGAIPPKAPYSVTLQGKSVKLDDVERALYQKTMGEVSSDLIGILLENDVYKAMNNQEKLSVLKQIYSYSAVVAKGQLDWTSDYEVIKGIAPYVTEKDFNAMSYEERYKIVDDYIFSDYDGLQDIVGQEGQANFLINKKTSSMVLAATLVGDMDEAINLIDGIESRVQSYGWDKDDTAEEIKDKRTSVKTTLTRYWKEAYLYAYYTGNDKEQERILEMLVEIGLYGNRVEVKKVLKKWIEALEE